MLRQPPEEELDELLASVFPLTGVDTSVMQNLQYTFPPILLRESPLQGHDVREFLEPEAMFSKTFLVNSLWTAQSKNFTYIYS